MEARAYTADPYQLIASQVSQIRQTYASGRTLALEWRKEQLQQLYTMLTDHQLAFQEALYQDLHKGEAEAWTTEIGFVLSEIKHTLKHLAKWAKLRKVSTPLAAMPAKSYILPEPLGSALIIGAWNYPLQLVLAPLVSAIAAGNCAVLKPSEISSHTSAALAKYIPEYLDNDAFAVVEGAVDETSALLAQPFEHMFYTGGENVARIVMTAAAKHLARVTLELGGKSPCIIDRTADLQVTANRIVWSKWMNAGQTCVAPDYLLVEKGIEQSLLDAIGKSLKQFYGKSVKDSHDYGRIVNERHFQRLCGYLKGQQILLGGEVDAQSRFIAPTVLKLTDDSPAVMQDEIFGPILPMLVMEDIQDSIAFVKQRPKPLALYLYSQDPQMEARILNQTSAGNVCINDGMMFMVNPELPFGGVGPSGMGSYHGKFGFDAFSHLKTVMKRSLRFDVPLRYPPFNRLKLGLLKKIL